jgi:hypothetical protein
MPELDNVFVSFNDKSVDARSADGSVMDVDDSVVGVSGSSVADGVHDDFVVRVMVSPNRRLTKEVGEGWIRVGHGDKIILSADAGAKVNKLF